MSGINIILLGPQGCGKGTQAELLSEKLGIPNVSAGQLCRDEAAKITPFGKKIKSIIDKGNLIPDKWMLGLILKRTKKKDCKNGFILDGYPRNRDQLKGMKKLIEGKKLKVDIVFRLNIPEKESIKRLSTRRQCVKCGAIYNLLAIKPKKAGKCDKCGSALAQREDDKPAAIIRRLELYNKNTNPIFSYFAKKNVLVDINGNQGVEKVHKDIMKELKKRE